MTDNVTPIPKRASRKSPEPIQFPAPQLTPDIVPHPEPRTAKLALPERLKPHLRMDLDTGEVIARVDEAQIRPIVAKLVARAIHGAACRMSDADIVEMGEAQFEAFIRSILEDE